MTEKFDSDLIRTAAAIDRLVQRMCEKIEGIKQSGHVNAEQIVAELHSNGFLPAITAQEIVYAHLEHPEDYEVRPARGIVCTNGKVGRKRKPPTLPMNADIQPDISLDQPLTI